MKRRIVNSELDRVLRFLLRSAEAGSQDEAPDAVFLAGYREKLRGARARLDALPLPIGEWSWQAAPVLLLILAFLVVSFWSLSGGVAPPVDPSEGLLWTVVEEGEPDLTPDQIVEIAVVRNSGR